MKLTLIDGGPASGKNTLATLLVDKFLKDNFTIVAIGERLLIKEYVTQFINKLEIACPVYLYHLSVPLTLRKQRLHQRGPYALIDLEKDQKERDEVKT